MSLQDLHERMTTLNETLNRIITKIDPSNLESISVLTNLVDDVNSDLSMFEEVELSRANIHSNIDLTQAPIIPRSVIPPNGLRNIGRTDSHNRSNNIEGSGIRVVRNPGRVDLFFSTSSVSNGDLSNPTELLNSLIGESSENMMNSLLGDLFRDIGNIGNQSNVRDVVVPLDDNIIEKIPTFKYSELDHSLKTDTKQCIICLMDYNDENHLRKLPCNHIFHADCVERWFDQSVKCPVCRKDMRDLILYTELDNTLEN